MNYHVLISNLPAETPATEKLISVKGFYAIEMASAGLLSFDALDFESQDQLYQVIAALGLGQKNGCKVDITATGETKQLDDNLAVIQAGCITADKVMTLKQQQESAELTSDREVTEVKKVPVKSHDSDDLVAVYYFINAVFLVLSYEGVEPSDLKEDLADGEAELIALLADYAVAASKTVTRLYSETGAALPGKFEYEMLDQSSELIKEFANYILDPKPTLPEMEVWEQICVSIISKWMRGGNPLSVNDILSSVKAGTRDIAMANFELRDHKIMIASYAGGEFRIKQL